MRCPRRIPAPSTLNGGPGYMIVIFSGTTNVAERKGFWDYVYVRDLRAVL